MRLTILESRLSQKAIVRLLILSIAMLFVAFRANAAEHFVSSSTTTVNCGTFGGGVRPGDTITLAAGVRGPLTIRDCTGTASSPITVRNDVRGNGPTVIRRTSASSGGFVFVCRDCLHVVIDGTGKWNGATEGAYCGAPAGTKGCGIKVTSVAVGDSPSAYLKLNRMTTKVTIRGVEVDGRRSDLNTSGSGIDLNDHNVKTADHPGFWREDIIFEQNYVHDVGNSGFYIGPNWREPDLDVPLRNITIRHNLVERPGRDGMKLKMAIAGTNRIHHNVVRRTGLAGNSKFGAGIEIYEGGHNLKVYNNWIEAPGIQGIQHFNGNIPSSKGPFSSEIFNNVVYDSGQQGNSNSHGITVASRDGSAEIVPSVFNNTVVKTLHAGINFGSNVRKGVVRDNIVAGWGTSALSVGGNTSSNNRTGSVGSIKFADAGKLNFALASDSPARDAGSPTGFPSSDFLSIARPQGSKADQGAFEFSSAGAPPRPPEPASVQ